MLVSVSSTSESKKLSQKVREACRTRPLLSHSPQSHSYQSYRYRYRYHCSRWRPSLLKSRATVRCLQLWADTHILFGKSTLLGVTENWSWSRMILLPAARNFRRMSWRLVKLYLSIVLPMELGNMQAVIFAWLNNFNLETQEMSLRYRNSQVNQWCFGPHILLEIGGCFALQISTIARVTLRL